MSLARAPLSDEESTAVIRGVFAAGTGSATLEASIKARAEGNPLFLEELSRGVVERRDADLVDVPATIDDAIARRLTRLAPRPRRVVSALAVIGRDTPSALARAVLEVPDAVFQAAVDQLCRADFLHETSVDGEPGYTFRHALVQEVAYARVPSGERRALHVRVLDMIERLYPDRAADHVERLAHHAVLGGTTRRAVTYLALAAEKAAARAARRGSRAHRAWSVAGACALSAARDRVQFDLEEARGRACSPRQAIRQRRRSVPTRGRASAVSAHPAMR
jgi:predicted ATPase